MDRTTLIALVLSLLLLGLRTGAALGEETVPGKAPAAGDSAELDKALQARLGEFEALSKDVRDLEKRLVRLRSTWEASRANLQRELGRAQREVDLARDRCKVIEKETREKKRALAKLEKKADSVTAVVQGLAARARSYFSAVAARIESGIPWRRAQRIQAVRVAESILEGEKPNAISVLSAVDRIQKREEAVGRITESGTLRIQQDGKKREVQAFHLGRLGLIFADKEGTVGGFVGPGQTLEEGMARARKNPDALGTFIRAIDILFKRRAPHIADLFLPGLPTKKTAARPERKP